MRYDLVDRVGPFPWPDAATTEYAQLAGMLAALTEQSLDAVLDAKRSNTRSANHAVEIESLSVEGQQRWGELYAQYGLDQQPYGDIQPVTISYCYGAGDARRIWMALDTTYRVGYPIWWDPDHKVSGDDDVQRALSVCISDCVHPPEQ